VTRCGNGVSGQQVCSKSPRVRQEDYVSLRDKRSSLKRAENWLRHSIQVTDASAEFTQILRAGGARTDGTGDEALGGSRSHAPTDIAAFQGGQQSISEKTATSSISKVTEGSAPLGGTEADCRWFKNGRPSADASSEHCSASGKHACGITQTHATGDIVREV
jgi:hypothetical protein